MEPRFLLDTNVFIHIRQRRPPAVLARFNRLKPGEAAISVVTYGELLYGVEKRRLGENAFRQLTELASLLPVLDLPTQAGASYAAIRAALETKGEIIGNNDLWIAAHAEAAGLILVTNNEKEFRRIPRLKIQNWIE